MLFAFGHHRGWLVSSSCYLSLTSSSERVNQSLFFSIVVDIRTPFIVTFNFKSSDGVIGVSQKMMESFLKVW